MNYKNIYDNIIKKRLTSSPNGYSERHHIVPRCLGGSDTKENIVSLTAKEHFLCHQLLCKIYPGESKLIFAAWMMTNCENEGQIRYRVTGRTYKWLREQHARSIGEFNKWRSGLTMKDITGDPNYTDPRKGKTMAEIYGEDHKHSQAQPFKIYSSQGVHEYSCTTDFVNKTHMGSVMLNRLKKCGELKICRRKNTKHNYRDGEVIKLEFIVE